MTNYNQTVLTGKDFIGVIKEGSSADNSGRYMVHIRELNPHDSSLKPIWAKNEVSGNRFSRWVDFSSRNIFSSGSYFPLHAGMIVNVRFRNNLMESAYISNVVSYIPLIDKEKNRDSFYLLNKTVGGSWIYQDDSRNYTHVMHNNGNSNMVLDDDGITLAVGKTINNGLGGFIPMNAFKVDAGGTKIEFGNNAIICDDTGITLKAGDTIVALTETGLKLLSNGNIDMETKKDINIKGKKAHVSGQQELHLHSNITRVSGGAHLSLTSSVINVKSMQLLSLNSNGQVNMHGTIKTKITGPMMEIKALTNLYVNSSVIDITGETTVVDGGSLTLNGGSVMMDGPIMHGIGTASSVATSMKAMNISLGLSTDAANAAVVTALGNSDPVSGVANSIMTSGLCGSADAAGSAVRPVYKAAVLAAGISEKISYVTSANEAFNQVTYEQFKDLRNTHTIVERK